jgi:hypothetical protein
MELFINSIYEEDMPYLGVLRQAFKTAKSSYALPALVKEFLLYTHAVSYLSDKTQAFIFDMKESQEELAAHMGSFAAKAFSLSQSESPIWEPAISGARISVGGETFSIDSYVEKKSVSSGTFYDLRFAVRGRADIDAQLLNEIKIKLIEVILASKEIKSRLASQGLDLSQVEHAAFINDKGVKQPQSENISAVSVSDPSLFSDGHGILADLSDRRLANLRAKAAVIANAALADREAQKIKTRTANESLLNEKVHVSALDGQAGIGEITALPSYASELAKEKVYSLTLNDAAPQNPLIPNWTLLDFSKIEGVKKQDIDELSVAKSQETDQTADARKFKAAAKIYPSLSDKTKAEINKYLENSAWLNDEFAKSEIEKRGLYMSVEEFKILAAMQSYFFEIQLKEALADIPKDQTKVSVRLNGITSENAAAALEKWTSLGIFSFVIETKDISALSEIERFVKDFPLPVSVSIKTSDEKIIQEVLSKNFIPVLPLSLAQTLKLPKGGFAAELDDEALQRAQPSSSLVKAAQETGAVSIDYLIGLLWGQRNTEEAVQRYRIPIKVKRKAQDLLQAVREALEESYDDAYAGALSKGRGLKVSAKSFDVLKTVSVNGADLPAVFAAQFLGNTAKNKDAHKLFELLDSLDGGFAVKLFEALGVLEKPTAQDLFSLLSAYRVAEGKNREIAAAKIAGFLQGLSENLIIEKDLASKGAQFVSQDLERVYAKLISAKALLSLRLSYGPDEKAEKILTNINEILDAQTINEARPLLVQLLRNAGIAGFEGSLEDIKEDEEGAQKINRVYSEIAEIMIDVLADFKTAKEDIRKSAPSISVDAVRDILSAA